MAEGNYISGILVVKVLLSLFGSHVSCHRTAGSSTQCLKIKQSITPTNYSVVYITAVDGEKIIQAPPSDDFFLPAAPRSVLLKRFNFTHASLQWSPSSAGLQNLRYYLLQITEEADGPKLYITYILVNVTAVNIIQKDSLFNFTCIRIHPQVYRLYVKMWALSGDAQGMDIESIYKKGEYSNKISNYLSVMDGKSLFSTEKPLHDQGLHTQKGKRKRTDRGKKIRHRYNKIKADCPLP